MRFLLTCLMLCSDIFKSNALRSLFHRQIKTTIRCAARFQPQMNPDLSEAEVNIELKEKLVSNNHFYSKKSWLDLKPQPSLELLQQMKGTGVEDRPSKIQVASWHEVRSEKPVLIADQTGSGKTLAYLFPLIDMLLNDINQESPQNSVVDKQTKSALINNKRNKENIRNYKDKQNDKESTSMESSKPFHFQSRYKHYNVANGRIRALILCPTTELTIQTGQVVRRMSPKPLKVMVATGGADRPVRTQKDMLEEGVDVLVATVGRAAALVVLDEVDVVVLDATFPIGEIGAAVLKQPVVSSSKVNKSFITNKKMNNIEVENSEVNQRVIKPRHQVQYIFVTATLPDIVVKKLKNEFSGDLRLVRGPGLHKVSPLLKLDVIDCALHIHHLIASKNPNDKKHYPSYRTWKHLKTDGSLMEEDSIYESNKEINLKYKKEREIDRQKEKKTFQNVNRDHHHHHDRSSSIRRGGVLVKGGNLPFEEMMRNNFKCKMSALLQVLDQSESLDTPRTLIFCNTIESCRHVENALKKSDKKSVKRIILSMHAGISEPQRRASLTAFCRHESNILQPVVLVCTDRASRGVDFGGLQAPVGHVVLFDWPRDPAEFLRRVGRTARAGNDGRCTALVIGRQTIVAKGITDAVKKGNALATVEQTPAEFTKLRVMRAMKYQDDESLVRERIPDAPSPMIESSSK